MIFKKDVFVKNESQNSKKGLVQSRVTRILKKKLAGKFRFTDDGMSQNLGNLNAKMQRRRENRKNVESIFSCIEFKKF